ncbi:MAG TPA: hypothetical protein VF708_12080 [Pyrinomonadaceae bacterium]|jgi:hypothetical protein
METLIRILSVFTPITRRLGICGDVGLIAGALSGFIIADFAWAAKGLYFTDKVALLNALILTLFTWIVVLFILCVQAKFTFRSVALPSLFNCFLTCLLTTFISKWLKAYSFAWIIGMVVGGLIGLLLCRINSLINRGEIHGKD